MPCPKKVADQTESAHGTRLTCRLQMKPYGSEFLWLIRRRKGASRTTPFRCLLPLVFPPKFSIQQGPSRNRFASLQRPYFRQWQGQWRRCDLSLFLTLLLPLSFPRPPPHRTKSPGPYLECAVSLNRDQPPQCPPASLGFATSTRRRRRLLLRRLYSRSRWFLHGLGAQIASGACTPAGARGSQPAKREGTRGAGLSKGAC